MSRNPCLLNSNQSVDAERVHDIEVIGYRYVMLSVCIFGIVCNMLNLCVLLQRRLKESPYTYLTGLALADMFTLICMSPVSIVRGDYIRNEQLVDFFTRLETRLYVPLANYFGQVSIMITVALTIERYLFTTYPLRTRSFCKASYARMVIGVIVGVCALISFPRFLTESIEKRRNTTEYFNPEGCTTHVFLIESSLNQSHIGQCFCMVGSADRRYISWVNYYYYTLLTFTQILPFAILLCLNLSLIRRVQTANRQTLAKLVARQHSTCYYPSGANHSNKQKRLRDEHRLTKTLVSIVIVFLVCNTFTIVSYPRFVRYITEKRYPSYYRVGFRIQRLITNIMLLLNYSVNFFFYCAFNEKFLEALKSIFSSRPCCSRPALFQRPTIVTYSNRSSAQQSKKIHESNRSSLDQIQYLRIQQEQQELRRKNHDDL